jgi:hypothetical protein
MLFASLKTVSSIGIVLLTTLEFACGPIFVVLLVNFRRGKSANGSWKERIICAIKKLY